MYNGEINIIYDIKKDVRYINIFGNNFVMNNKDKCKMIIDNKVTEITEKFFVNNNYNNNKLNIILKGVNDIINMSYMFYECKSLSSLPDISKWKTNNITNMSYMFGGCSSLSSLLNISNWNTNNVTNMNNMFDGCSSLLSLPDISKWNTNNVKNMSYCFMNVNHYHLYRIFQNGILIK